MTLSLMPMNHLPLAIGIPTGPELYIVLGVVVLLFGSAKIPQLMRGLGQGVGELKKGLDEGKKAFSEKDDEKKDEPKPEEK